jgi:2'-5' RNA ligase
MDTITKSMAKTSLFFIALIPDKDLRKKIHTIKEDFSQRFYSHKALKVYPHITLKAPFKCSAGGKKELLNWFSETSFQQKPFLLYLKGFGAFHNKNSPVVFINPMPSKELLQMQNEMMVGFSSIFPAYVHPVDVGFKPHITVAYRDLTPENFSRAWQEYKDKPFKDVFGVHSIYLLEHNTKKWNIIATRTLGE